MSDSQQPQTPLSRLEQLERQIASKFESLLQGVRDELGEGVRLAGEEIQEFVQTARRRAEEATAKAESARQKAEEAELAAADDADAAAEGAESVASESDVNAVLASVVRSVGRIDGEFGQADVIQGLLAESGKFSSRAAFFLIRQGQLRAWSSVGFGAGGGRLEGLQASTESAPWQALSESGKTVGLDADQRGEVSQALGVAAPTQAVWVPFVLRGQLAGALYADRLEGDGLLGVAGLQLLTHSAARTLETAAANPDASPTLDFVGELPELPRDEHTVAVRHEEEEAEDQDQEEPVAASDEAADVAPVVEPPQVEVPEVEIPDTTPEPTATEPEAPAVEAEVTEKPEEAEEAEEPTDASGTAESDAAAAASARAVPDVETLDEASSFEMVEEDETDAEPEADAEAAVLEDQVAAPSSEVPDVGLGEPAPAPVPDLEAEAPEVPDLEVGEPGEDAEKAPSAEDLATEDAAAVDAAAEDAAAEEAAPEDISAQDIQFEAEPEAPLDEDTNIWEVEEDEEPTAVDEDEAAAQEAPTPVPTGSETVRIDRADLPQAATPPAPEPEPAGEEPASDDGSQPGYPSSFAEPPPPVSAPPSPTSFGGEDETEAGEETPSSQVAPPPDVQPASQVSPPAAEAQAEAGVEAEAEPASQVTPPEPAAPAAPEEATPSSQVTPPPAEPEGDGGGGSTEVKPPSDLDGPGLAFAAPPPGEPSTEVDDAEEALHEEARRLARLLVSEIKLYNEEVIEEGRRAGNIYERLKDDIDRSRQMYEERIDPRLADKEDYFYQELVQRLAGGDENLLGM